MGSEKSPDLGAKRILSVRAPGRDRRRSRGAWRRARRRRDGRRKSMSRLAFRRFFRVSRVLTRRFAPIRADPKRRLASRRRKIAAPSRRRLTRLPHASPSAGPQPMDLYGKFTWKIENFSEISKRELRSNVFEVGGMKWCVTNNIADARDTPPAVGICRKSRKTRLLAPPRLPPALTRWLVSRDVPSRSDT